MSRISEHVSQWAGGSATSDCALAGPLPDPGAATPTLVIAQASLRCDSDKRGFKGIVFFDHEPVAWCCLTGDEIEDFKAWGAAALPTAQVVTVGAAVETINCPPPIPKATGGDENEVENEVEIEDMRNALRALAPAWFALASAKSVA